MLSDEPLEEWLFSKMEPDPNPGGFLGFIATTGAAATGTLTRNDFYFFTHSIVLEHVVYYEEMPDGTKTYECVECPQDA